MKKIMGAVLAAAMLAGIATASDIGFSYKGSNYFKAGGSDSKYFRYEENKRSDCLSVSLATDVAGVVIDYDYDDGNSGTIKPDEYYGWVNIGLPLGSLQVTAGAWNGRWVNRVITDKGDLDREDFELFKPGVINGLTGKDSDNLTNGNLGMVAAWTLADTLPGTLMVKLGLAKYNNGWGDDWFGTKDNNWNGTVGHGQDFFWNTGTGPVKVRAGFTGEVAYQQEGAFRANFAVRSLNKHTYSFGAWVSPLIADNLQLTVGGTVATGKLWKFNNGDGWSNRKTEWGLDFRLRLQVTDDLSITTMNNISSGVCNNPSLKDKNGDSQVGKNIGVLWNMLNATYAFADNLTAGLTVQSVADMFCPAVNKSDNWTAIISPSLAIQASEQVRVTTSARAKMAYLHNRALRHIELTVPVIFTFNY